MKRIKSRYLSDKDLVKKRENDPDGYYPKIITPTLGRRAIVVEDEYFKSRFKKSKKELLEIIKKHKKKLFDLYTLKKIT